MPVERYAPSCGVCFLDEPTPSPLCIIHNPPSAPSSRVADETLPSVSRGQTLVHGERQATYGHPRQNMERIAAMWSALTGAQIAAEQVPLMMIVLKVSRLWHKIEDDGLDDVDGYAEVIRVLSEPTPDDRQAAWDENTSGRLDAAEHRVDAMGQDQ